MAIFLTIDLPGEPNPGGSFAYTPKGGAAQPQWEDVQVCERLRLLGKRCVDEAKCLPGCLCRGASRLHQRLRELRNLVLERPRSSVEMDHQVRLVHL